MNVTRLGGLDAAFLALENPLNPLHVMAIMVLDPSTVPDGFSADRFVATLADRLPRLAPLRRRVVDAPLGLSRPVWSDGETPDLAHHLRRATLDPPGDMVALAAFAASIADVTLDRARPLWELYVVEGCANGRIAVVAKLHHSLMDGAAGMEFMGALLTLSPDTEPALPDLPTPARPQAWRDRLENAATTALALARTPAAVARATIATGTGMLRLARARTGPGHSTMPFAGPRTPFGGSATGHRAIALASVPRADVDAVCAATGTTINDVLLAGVAGSLRAWLHDHGGIPDRRLVAAVPVSAHDAARPETANALAVALVKLATDLDDPGDRLTATAAAASAAKRTVAAVGTGTLTAWLDVVWAPLVSVGGRLYSTLQLANRHPPLCNLLVSNVVGPPMALYLAGARLVALHPLGPVYEGLGLNVTAISREDAIDIGLVAWREHVPDLDALARGIGAAIAELLDGEHVAVEA